MKAIRTRFYGPTNFKGSRYTATDGDGNRVTLSADYALNSDANHERVAKALMTKMRWPNELNGGGFGHDYYWTMIPRNCEIVVKSQAKCNAALLDAAREAQLLNA